MDWPRIEKTNRSLVWIDWIRALVGGKPCHYDIFQVQVSIKIMNNATIQKAQKTLEKIANKNWTKSVGVKFAVCKGPSRVSQIQALRILRKNRHYVDHKRFCCHVDVARGIPAAKIFGVRNLPWDFLWRFVGGGTKHSMKLIGSETLKIKGWFKWIFLWGRTVSFRECSPWQ